MTAVNRNHWDERLKRLRERRDPDRISEQPIDVALRLMKTAAILGLIDELSYTPVDTTRGGRQKSASEGVPGGTLGLMAALGLGGAGIGYGMHRLGNLVAPHASDEARRVDRNISTGMGAGFAMSPVVSEALRKYFRNRKAKQIA